MVNLINGQSFGRDGLQKGSKNENFANLSIFIGKTELSTNFSSFTIFRDFERSSLFDFLPRDVQDIVFPAEDEKTLKDFLDLLYFGKVKITNLSHATEISSIAELFGINPESINIDQSKKNEEFHNVESVNPVVTNKYSEQDLKESPQKTEKNEPTKEVKQSENEVKSIEKPKLPKEKFKKPINIVKANNKQDNKVIQDRYEAMKLMKIDKIKDRTPKNDGLKLIWKCKLCVKKNLSKNHMKYHSLSHIEKLSEMFESDSSDSDSNTTCHVPGCNQIYRSISSLKYHIVFGHRIFYEEVENTFEPEFTKDIKLLTRLSRKRMRNMTKNICGIGGCSKICGSKGMRLHFHRMAHFRSELSEIFWNQELNKCKICEESLPRGNWMMHSMHEHQYYFPEQIKNIIFSEQISKELGLNLSTYNEELNPMDYLVNDSENKDKINNDEEYVDVMGTIVRTEIEGDLVESKKDPVSFIDPVNLNLNTEDLNEEAADIKDEPIEFKDDIVKSKEEPIKPVRVKGKEAKLKLKYDNKVYFKCKDCGKSFSCRPKINSHVMTHLHDLADMIDVGKKPYFMTCPIQGCSEMHKSLTGLKMHIVFKHNLFQQEAQDLIEPAFSSDEKFFQSLNRRKFSMSKGVECGIIDCDKRGLKKGSSVHLHRLAHFRTTIKEMYFPNETTNCNMCGKKLRSWLSHMLFDHAQLIPDNIRTLVFQ